MARAASIEPSQVIIEQVVPLSSDSRAGRRKLLAGSIKVTTAVTAPDAGAAATVSSALTPDRINYQLQMQGMREAQVCADCVSHFLHHAESSGM